MDIAASLSMPNPLVSCFRPHLAGAYWSKCTSLIIMCRINKLSKKVIYWGEGSTDSWHFYKMSSTNGLSHICSYSVTCVTWEPQAGPSYGQLIYLSHINHRKHSIISRKCAGNQSQTGPMANNSREMTIVCFYFHIQKMHESVLCCASHEQALSVCWQIIDLKEHTYNSP